MIAERFPDHVVLGEEFGSRTIARGIPHYCWVFDPIDGTTNYAHGLPIFCSSLALEIDGEPVVAAVYDPNRRELFTAERGQGAWLNGRPLRVSAADTLIDSLLVTGFHYDVQKDPGEVIEPLRGVHQPGARGPAAGFGGARPLLRRRRPLRRRSGRRSCSRGTSPPGALIVAEAGGRVTTMAGAPLRLARGQRAGDQRPHP